MSTYWSVLHQMNRYMSHLHDHLQSSRIPIPMQYKSILFQLQNELSEINHYNLLLKSHTKTRQRRGLINGIGNLANTLFGVLDDRFAKQYEMDIEKITANENHLQLLLKNQTNIIEAENNILQRNEAIMNKQLTMVQSHLQEISRTTEYIQSRFDHELYFISASIILSSLRNIQENLINTITDLASGHMNSHLLPPEQLEQQMNIIIAT